MLSSGGDINTPVKVNIGGQGTASSGTTLTLSPNEPASKFDFVQPGFSIVGRPPANQSNPIQADTKVVSIDRSAKTVVMDKPLVASQGGATFDFFRPVNDYASEAMIKLWYSWVKIYLDSTAGTPSKSLAGAVTTNSATLTFGVAQTGLIEGMQVTGPGLPNPDPGKLKGGVIILAVSADKRSVTLSQLSS